ncbi:MAG: hypothetical protein WAJ86_12100 [Candidatus Acidiferrales bacterium]
MRPNLPSRRWLFGAAACIAGALSLPLAGQRIATTQQRTPMFQDWSTRFVVYPRMGPMNAMQAAAQDPRARQVWSRPLAGGGSLFSGGTQLGGRSASAFSLLRRPSVEAGPTPRDWAINLGAAGTAQSMYPAKYGFDSAAPPSCTNDYVVFPVNAMGSSTQPNIVAFNQLYSGTAGANGICNRKATSSDAGVAAEVIWSYNVQGILGGGAVTTSPVISYDMLTPSASGTKIAFVESATGGPVLTDSLSAGGSGYAVGDTGTIAGGTVLATYKVTGVTTARRTTGVVSSFTIASAGTGYSVATGATTTKTSGNGSGLTINILTVGGYPAHFHVLAPNAGDGQNTGNLQSVLSPKTITAFSLTSPAAGSGAATDLALGSSSAGTDTLSSPFVDYTSDKAYVGNDVGVLYRIKDVFCTSGNPDCSGATKPGPSLDATWGTGGAVTVCSGTLTAPILDFVTLNVFVGCSDGKLYGFNSSGAPLAHPSVTVGNGTALGGVVDAPIVDGVDGFVYAVSGSNGANAVLVQASADLSGHTTMPVGAAGIFNLHEPAFNSTFYTSPTTAGAMIYVAAYNGAGDEIELYAYCFNSTSGVLANCPGVSPAGPQMVSLNTATGSQLEYAPLTEYYNTTTSTDWLFVGVLQNRNPNIGLFNINSFPASATLAASTQEGSGASGMVVDNSSSSGQASSIYFGALSTTASCGAGGTGGCAVKLTQAGLQ